MRFRLTDKQQALQDEVRTFAQNEIKPQAIALDHQEAYPTDILAELGERRLTGLTLSEEYGGRGDGLVELALLTEELAAALMSVASTLGLHLSVATIIEQFGTDEQRDGDDWVVNGHKRWVTNYQNADVVLTYAKTGPDEEAPHNISAFLIPVEEFEVDKVWDTLGAHSAKAIKITLSDVRVSDKQLIARKERDTLKRGTVNTGVERPRTRGRHRTSSPCRYSRVYGATRAVRPIHTRFPRCAGGGREDGRTCRDSSLAHTSSRQPC